MTTIAITLLSVIPITQKAANNQAGSLPPSRLDFPQFCKFPQRWHHLWLICLACLCVIGQHWPTSIHQESIYALREASLVLILALIVPNPHAPVLQHDVYNVASGKRTGIRETWYKFKHFPIQWLPDSHCRPDAGDATQGVPGGHVTRVHVIVPRDRRPKRKNRRTAYVVFEALRPGIYNTW